MDQLFSTETLVLAAVFLAVVAAVTGVWGMLRRDEPVGRIGKSPDKTADKGADKGDTIVDWGVLPKALRLIEPLQRRLTQSDPDQVGQTRRTLIDAGFYDRQAIDVFFSARLVLAIGFAAAASVALFVVPTPLSGNPALLVVLSAVALGYYAPVLWLRRRVSTRRNAFARGLPDAMDMILVGVQAGLSLAAALRHVVEELGDAHPVVAEQFQAVSLEFQAGMGHAEALQRMAARMNVSEAKTFATMVSQAESLGAGLSDTLEVIADEMRTARELRAEQYAAELPVRMSIPLVLLVLPCLLLVIMAPVVINIINTFEGLGR